VLIDANILLYAVDKKQAADQLDALLS